VRYTLAFHPLTPGAVASFSFPLGWFEVPILPNVLIMADIRRKTFGVVAIVGWMGSSQDRYFLFNHHWPHMMTEGRWPGRRPSGVKPGKAGRASGMLSVSVSSPAVMKMVFVTEVMPSSTKVSSSVSIVVPARLGTLALVVVVLVVPLASSLYGGRPSMVLDCSRSRSWRTEISQSPYTVNLPRETSPEPWVQGPLTAIISFRPAQISINWTVLVTPDAGGPHDPEGVTKASCVDR